MRKPKGLIEELSGFQSEESGRALRRFFILLQYGSSTVPLARCAELFGFSPDEAAKRAARAALPVPAFRCGSQKSPWLVNVDDLTEYLENQRRQALQEWQKINS
jgi:hypothetical protein